MKKCLTCGALSSSVEAKCPDCGTKTETISDFLAYAPELEGNSSGFKESYFQELFELEKNHFWFQNRNHLILLTIQKYCPMFKSFLEVGCGTGYVLSAIANRYSACKLIGSEIFTTGLKFAAQRQPNVEFIQMDARRIPFHNEFDLIGAFDVLEHIAEDRLVLRQLYESLSPGGTLLLTVPQHQWLWSPSDDYACHARRYSARDLHQKLAVTGFKVLRSTSFVTTLLPIMLVSRMRMKQQCNKPEFDVMAELRISPPTNLILSRILAVEVHLIRYGFNLPIGGSRLVVARKI
jgi:SAM-dependent methyltransferase